MIKYIQRIQNIGISTNTDIETAKRVRLCNSMSIVGISTGFAVLLYATLTSWPYDVFLLHVFIIVATFIPPTLNYFQKTIASRISFLLVANLSIVCLSITIGKFFHFQYFLSATLCMPLIFFGNEFRIKKLFFSALTILLFIYLEWHFRTFEPLISIDKSYSDIIRFVNDFMILLMIFSQFYFFVNENDSYTENIVEKSNELQEKNIQLEHFAYIASHDLNEPLRTINSFVDIIQEEYEDPADENLNTYFSFIRDALTRMRLMIDGLLNYSRLGKSSDYQVVNINHLISDIETDLGELIKQQNVTIQANNLPAIRCLAQETRQLFQNLISNAIKFQQSDVAPILEIKYKEIPDYWQFCVADNGIGISSKKHETIFRMFTKLHLPDEYEGHGIGLAFCKKIVEIHKGKIWVESSPGKGSQFYFTIHKNI